MTEAALPGTGPGEMFEIREEDVDGVRLKVFTNAPPSLRFLWELSGMHGEDDLKAHVASQLAGAPA